MNPFNQKTRNAGLIQFLGNRGHKYIDQFDPESEDESESDSSDVSDYPITPTVMAPTVKLYPEYDEEDQEEDERPPVETFDNNLLIEDAFAKIHDKKIRQVVATQHRKYLVYEEQASGSHKLQPNKRGTKRLSAKEVKEIHPEFADINFVDTSGGAMFNSFGQTHTQESKTLVVHSSQGNPKIPELIEETKAIPLSTPLRKRLNATPSPANTPDTIINIKEPTRTPSGVVVPLLEAFGLSPGTKKKTKNT